MSQEPFLGNSRDPESGTNSLKKEEENPVSAATLSMRMQKSISVPNKKIQTVNTLAVGTTTIKRALTQAEINPEDKLANLFFSKVGLSNFFDEDNLNCLTSGGISYSLHYLRIAGGIDKLKEQLRTDENEGIKCQLKPVEPDANKDIQDEITEEDSVYNTIEKEVSDRKETYGKNDPMPSNLSSWGTLVASFFEDFTTRLLMLVCVISIILQLSLPENEKQQTYIEGGAVFGTLIVISIIQAIVTRAQEKRIQDIKLASSTTRVSVIRQGKRQNIGSNELVVGDVIKLSKGQQVPADCILIDTNKGGIKVTDGCNVETEFIQSIKDTNKDPFVTGKYFILDGYCTAIVCAVGTRAQFGMIKESISTASYKESGFQKKLDHVIETIAMTAYGAGLAIFIAACIWTTIQIVNADNYYEQDLPTAFYTQKYVQVFMLSVTLVMVIVPEGLNLIVTLSLAYSLQRLQDQNNIVQSLESPEVMATVQSIVTESSGILTDANMKVKECYFYHDQDYNKNQFESVKKGENKLSLFLAEAILYCSSCYEEQFEVIKHIPNDDDLFINKQNIQTSMESRLTGNKTDKSLVNFIQEAKIGVNQNFKEILNQNEKMESNMKILFTSQRKYSAQQLKRQVQKNDESSDKSLPSLFQIVEQNDTDEVWVFKGSKDVLLDKCSKYIDENGQEVVLTEPKIKLIKEQADEIEKNRTRTVLLCYKAWKKNEDDRLSTQFDRCNHDSNNQEDIHISNNLVFISLLGMKDDLRKDLGEAIDQCRSSEIKVRMLTGDSDQVALKLATQARIIIDDSTERYSENKIQSSNRSSQRAQSKSSRSDIENQPEITQCMTSSCLQIVAKRNIKQDQLSEQRLKRIGINQGQDKLNREALFRYIRNKCWQDINNTKFDVGQFFEESFLDQVCNNLLVLSEVEPQDSRFFIAILQAKEIKVASTGSSDKDFQILKSANVGYSMGKNGSDIANHGADVILLDDNFKSMLSTVNFGRNIFRVVQEFIQFQIASNLLVFIPIFLSLCIYSESCLNPVQLLWINFITDCFAALVLGNQPPLDENLVGRQPKLDHILDRQMWRNIFGQAFYMILFSLVVLFAGADIFGLPPISTTTPLYFTDDYLGKQSDDYQAKYEQKPVFKIEAGEPTSKLVVYSLVFNVIICMTISQLFVRRFGPVNMNNHQNNADSRKSIKFFVVTCLILLVSQYLLMYFFSPMIGTTNLTINQYLFTMFIAFFQIVWTLLINVTIPDDILQSCCPDDEYQKQDENENSKCEIVNPNDDDFQRQNDGDIAAEETKERPMDQNQAHLENVSVQV